METVLAYKNRNQQSTKYNLCINSCFLVNVDFLFETWTKVGLTPQLICDMWVVTTDIPDLEVKHDRAGFISFRGVVDQPGRFIELENVDRRVVGNFDRSEKYPLTSLFTVKIEKASVPVSIRSMPRKGATGRLLYEERLDDVRFNYTGAAGLGFKNKFVALSSYEVLSSEVPAKGNHIRCTYTTNGKLEFSVLNSQEFVGDYHDAPYYGAKDPVEDLQDVRKFYMAWRDSLLGPGGGPPFGWGGSNPPFPYTPVNGFSDYEIHANLREVDSGTYRHLSQAEVNTLTNRDSIVNDAHSLHNHDDIYISQSQYAQWQADIASKFPHDHDDRYFSKNLTGNTTDETLDKAAVDALYAARATIVTWRTVPPPYNDQIIFVQENMVYNLGFENTMIDALVPIPLTSPDWSPTWYTNETRIANLEFSLECPDVTPQLLREKFGFYYLATQWQQQTDGVPRLPGTFHTHFRIGRYIGKASSNLSKPRLDGDGGSASVQFFEYPLDEITDIQDSANTYYQEYNPPNPTYSPHHDWKVHRVTATTPVIAPSYNGTLWAAFRFFVLGAPGFPATYQTRVRCRVSYLM